MNSEPELESLLQSLHDADPGARSQAIHTLGQLKSTQAIMALQNAVREDADPGCRLGALDELLKTEDPSLFNEALSHALNDPPIRLAAAWRIGSNARQGGRPNPWIVEPLIKALEGSSGSEFGIIIDALGMLHDRRAFEPLVRYLKSADSYQRGVTAQALGELGDRRAEAHLKALLDDQAEAWKEDYGPVMSVADVAQEALKQLRRRATSAAMPQTMQSGPPIIQEALNAIHDQDGDAIEGLRDKIQPEHIPLLMGTWQPSLPWPIKDGYVALLMDRVGEAVRPLMEDALRSPTAEMRAIALCSLKGNLDLFTSLLTEGEVDPDKVEMALQEYLSAQQGAG